MKNSIVRLMFFIMNGGVGERCDVCGKEITPRQKYLFVQKVYSNWEREAKDKIYHWKCVSPEIKNFIKAEEVVDILEK